MGESAWKRSDRIERLSRGGKEGVRDGLDMIVGL